MYEVNGFIKHSEEDVFADGCIPSSGGISADMSIRFNGATVDDLVKALMEFVGADDPDSVQIDACEDPGRIDIQVLENAEGHVASIHEIALWRTGKCRLWLCDYSFQAEFVDRRVVSLAV